MKMKNFPKTAFLLTVPVALLSSTAGAEPIEQSIVPSILHQDASIIQGLDTQVVPEASMLDRLQTLGSITMSNEDQARTRGESINGINELIQSRQLRYRIIRNSTDSNAMFINSRTQ